MDAQNPSRASSHPNRLLASLSQKDFTQLSPHLKPFELVHGDLLFDAGETVNWIYFPHSGVISLVIGLADGQLIEIAMVGRDSLVGASSAMDGKVSLNRGIVQVPGVASILEVDVLCDVAEKSLPFRHHADPPRATAVRPGPAVGGVQRLAQRRVPAGALAVAGARSDGGK